MNDDEFAQIIRSMIAHEDGLRDQKLNWLLASQGLLIAALGIAWGKEEFLVIGIAGIGLLFCISIGASLYTNTIAIRGLSAQWERRRPIDYSGPDAVGLRSAEITPSWMTKLYPWYILPVALIVFWVLTLLKVTIGN